MRPKTLVILGAIAAASAAGAIFLAPRSDVVDVKIGERIFPELAARAPEVRSIELQRPDGTVLLQRDGDSWIVPARAGYAADVARVRQLFVEVTDLRTLEAKTRNAELHASLEVEERDRPGAKSTRIAFRDGQGKELVALLAGRNRFGHAGGGQDAVYVRRAGDSQAWLAKGRLTVNRDIVQWLDRDLANIARERVRASVITHADGAVTRVSRPSPAEAEFTLADVPDGRMAKTGWEISSVAAAFERLEIDDVRKAADIAMPDDAPQTVITTFDGLELTTRFAEKDGATWVMIVARAEPPAQLPEGGPALKAADEVKAEAAAINRKAAGWAYRLPVFNATNLRKRVDELLEPKES